jgi:large subunit ribosomal protein L25
LEARIRKHHDAYQNGDKSMSDANIIAVELREGTGKGAARATRRQGLVPGVVYGGKNPAQSITVSRKELDKLINTGAFFNTLYELKAGDKTQKVLPRDVQFHPVTDVPLHVDFLRVAANAQIVISVPVIFEGEDNCPGLRAGGVLNVVRHEIEVNCRADAMPESITASLAGLEVGDSLHISAITLPEGVTPTITDRDFTVATIAAPSVAQPASEEGEEAESEAEATQAPSADEEEDAGEE